MYYLSQRLQAVADLVKVGESMADIGSDHAYLPIFLVGNGLVPWAIASELGNGPYEHTLEAVRCCALQDRIEVRQGDGLQTIGISEVATVVMAGMGGDSIVAILANDWSKASSYKQFIFQPMSRASILRRTLADRGWPIVDEKLLLDNNRYVLIMVSQPGNISYSLDPLEIEIGPEILKADNSLKRGYLLKYVEKYTKVYTNIKNSTQAEQRLLANTYRDKLERLELILNASQSS